MSDGIERAAQRIHDRHHQSFDICVYFHTEPCLDREDARVILDATKQATEKLEAIRTLHAEIGGDCVWCQTAWPCSHSVTIKAALACLQGDELPHAAKQAIRDPGIPKDL